MGEGLKQRCHGVRLPHEEDEELFDSDFVSGNSDDDEDNSRDDASSSSPNPSSPSSKASSLPLKLNQTGSLYELSSLMEQLPIKRGLSKYYQGKSQSFTSLSVVCSIEDLPKKENPNKKKLMKSCKSYAGGLDSSQKSAHAPGPCSKTISKKAPRVPSCAALMSKSSSSSLLCSSKPPLISNAFCLFETFPWLKFVGRVIDICLLKKWSLETGATSIVRILTLVLKSLKSIQAQDPHQPELYVALVEGAMVGYTPKGMQLAQETLEKMNARGYFLNAKMGSDLLLAAAGEKTGGYTTANYVWDLCQSRNIKPTLPTVKAYYEDLKEREIPSDDPRLVLVGRLYDNLNLRFGGRRNNQTF